jgi:hypothetical protein
MYCYVKDEVKIVHWPAMIIKGGMRNIYIPSGK